MRNLSPPFSWIKTSRGIVHFDHSQKKYGSLTKTSAVLELSLPPGIPERIAGECHIAHDDQLRVTSGEAIALILFKRIIYYIPLTPKSDALVIPKGTWHSLVNISSAFTEYQNWMLLYREPSKKDYFPAYIEHKFNVHLAEKSLQYLSVQSIVL